MPQKKFVIWNNFNWSRVSPELREKTLAQHNFVQDAQALAKAEIAFGQPETKAVKKASDLRWIHLTSAGYTRYDTEAFKTDLQKRGIALTNSSGVYAEPCAEHLFAMILALARCLPQAVENQTGAKDWNQIEQRKQQYLLQNQQILLLGYGSIARRLAEMLSPLGMRIFALRRHPGDEPNVTMLTNDELPKMLSSVDHIVDILPENDSTHHFVDADFLAGVKPNAHFYNIGRGSTVDQAALMAALREGRLAAAYLDVMTPEPLPPDNPLWCTPNCYITPHSGGGHQDEFERQLRHFLDNLALFEKGAALADRVF